MVRIQRVLVHRRDVPIPSKAGTAVSYREPTFTLPVAPKRHRWREFRMWYKRPRTQWIGCSLCVVCHAVLLVLNLSTPGHWPMAVFNNIPFGILSFFASRHWLAKYRSGE